ncbi:MAG: hypothetical protein BWY68_00262 [bacterium ADurb.Bin400]|nr:MAG: hypothetical protein BWY68_00262 [bacterium ADurb.Bin400]
MWQSKTSKKSKIDNLIPHSRVKKIIGIILVAFFAVLILTISFLSLVKPKVASTNLTNTSESFGLNQSIEVNFSQPIRRQEIELTISPAINGSWHFTDSILKKHLFKKAVFTPDQYLTPNTTYTITVSNFRNALGFTNPAVFNQTFTTQPVPTIASSSIHPNQTDVGICDPIILDLDHSNNGIVDFLFSLTPEAVLTVEKDSKGNNYSVKPTDCLAQGISYTLTAERILNLSNYQERPLPISRETVFSLNFTTKSPPAVASFTPQGTNVFVSTKQLSIEFAESMSTADPSPYISISPPIAGTWSWETPQKLVFSFTHSLPYATGYTITLAKGLPDSHQGFLQTDLQFHFSTIGHVAVNQLYPTNGAKNIPASATITFTFNQEVDHTSAEQNFSISPQTPGTFSWSGNKLSFKPTHGFNKDTSYSANLSPGIKSIHGLDSLKAYLTTFRTEESSIILNVKLDYQDKALSCEAAALKMALNYKGASVSENDIMAIIGFDPTIRQNDIWGDPDIAFVGDINGKLHRLRRTLGSDC